MEIAKINLGGMDISECAVFEAIDRINDEMSGVDFYIINCCYRNFDNLQSVTEVVGKHFNVCSFLLGNEEKDWWSVRGYKLSGEYVEAWSNGA